MNDDDFEEDALDRVSPLILFVISMLAFYFQAMVTEEVNGRLGKVTCHCTAF